MPKQNRMLYAPCFVLEQVITSELLRFHYVYPNCPKLILFTTLKIVVDIICQNSYAQIAFVAHTRGIKNVQIFG